MKKMLAMILAVFFAQIHPNYLTQQWQRIYSHLSLVIPNSVLASISMKIRF